MSAAASLPEMEFFELWGKTCRGWQRLSQHGHVADARACGIELAQFFTAVELRKAGKRLERWTYRERGPKAVHG